MEVVLLTINLTYRLPRVNAHITNTELGSSLFVAFMYAVMLELKKEGKNDNISNALMSNGHSIDYMVT